MVKRLVFLLWIILAAACTTESETLDPITLEPSQIAANLRQDALLSPTATRPTPEPLIISRLPLSTGEATAENPPPAVVGTEIVDLLLASPTPPVTVESTLAQTLEPTPLPTSNAESLQALVDNPNILLTAQLDTECFLAGDFIPFRLTALSLESEPIYFYREAKWMVSINNSPVGPQLASRIPTTRDEFVNVPPNETYVRQEEDLGLWVQSLGPDSGIAFSETGIGLPAGEYWVTFVYSNDQDGLQQQVDGSYLIDRAAWRGTAVAREIRLRVVSDLSQCGG